MRFAALILALGVSLPGAAMAQSTETLADIRQELSVLYVELQRLGRELNTTGGASGTGATGPALARMDAIEAELRRLTALTEELQLTIARVVNDGTTRVGDLEFRLCELETDCSISDLGETPSLGGVDLPSPSPSLPPAGGVGTEAGGPQLAVAEQDDFDRARAAYDAGDYATAASGFAAFTETYPGSPLSAEAHFMRGEAQAQQGAWNLAARAYLDSFTTDTNGARAPVALTSLGISLGRLGQLEEACVTLGEVITRYPGSGAVSQAQSEMARLGCS